jgi:hypothetical protein
MANTVNIRRPTYANTLATGSLTSYLSPTAHAAEMAVRDRDNPNYSQNSNMVNILIARQERLINTLMQRQDRILEERFKQHNAQIAELVTQTLTALLPEIITQIHQALTQLPNSSPEQWHHTQVPIYLFGTQEVWEIRKYNSKIFWTHPI